MCAASAIGRRLSGAPPPRPSLVLEESSAWVDARFQLRDGKCELELVRIALVRRASASDSLFFHPLCSSLPPIAGGPPVESQTHRDGRDRRQILAGQLLMNSAERGRVLVAPVGHY